MVTIGQKMNYVGNNLVLYQTALPLGLINLVVKFRRDINYLSLEKYEARRLNYPRISNQEFYLNNVQKLSIDLIVNILFES
jgi:hypothetical protein